MNMKDKLVVPQNIETMIGTLHNPNTSVHVRENTSMMLENVRDRCTHALQTYNIEKWSAKDRKRA